MYNEKAKIGVISYEHKKLINCKGAQNLGDWLQTFSMESLMSTCGVNEYTYVSRNTMSNLDENSMLLVYNGVWYLNDVHNASKTSLPEKKVIPFFWSVHFMGEVIPEELKNILIEHGPIGCRDTMTTNKLLANGIPAFTTGCVSALLDRREEELSKSAEEIFFIDTPRELDKYVPDNILKKAQYKTNVYKLPFLEGRNFTTNDEAKMIYKYAVEEYEYYRQHAKLVVTSRLHIASPCMAMGIPVILVDNHNIDGRFSWISKYLRIYYEEDFDEIDWNPLPVEYESDKQYIKSLFLRRFNELYMCANKGFENRKDDLDSGYLLKSNIFDDSFIYNRFISRQLIEGFEDIKDEQHLFCVWGIKEPITAVMNCMKLFFSKWSLQHAYDSVVEGCFEGTNIEKPERINAEKDVVYILLGKSIVDDVNYQKIKNERVLLIYK